MGLSHKKVELLASDLAPGDQRASAFDWTDFEVTRITSESDPLFETVYQRFADEFAAKGELEERATLHHRFKWNGDMRYEIIAVLRQGQFVAARDHTAILSRHAGGGEAIVHLSHVLIDPQFRGLGLVAWLRAWPLQVARATLASGGLDPRSPITLLCEMEPFDPEFVDRLIRLKSYQKAGFLMVDPAAGEYLQPDFRPPAAIDAGGGPAPLPLRLVLRRFGREREREITGAELRRMITALYTMYGSSFRKEDMAVVWTHLRKAFPPDDAFVRLVRPLEESP